MLFVFLSIRQQQFVVNNNNYVNFNIQTHAAIGGCTVCAAFSLIRVMLRKIYNYEKVRIFG